MESKALKEAVKQSEERLTVQREVARKKCSAEQGGAVESISSGDSTSRACAPDLIEKVAIAIGDALRGSSHRAMPQVIAAKAAIEAVAEEIVDMDASISRMPHPEFWRGYITCKTDVIRKLGKEW